jgi:chaperonin cofactor prefoldin
MANSTNYKFIGGKIIKVVEEDVTEQLKGQFEHFNKIYNDFLPKVHRREQLKQAIATYQAEAEKIDNEIKAAVEGLNKDIIKQIEPEKAAKLGF